MAFVWLCLGGVIVILLQGIIFGYSARNKISYSRVFGQSYCYAGDRVEMVETISNEKWLPVVWLRLEAMLPASLKFQNMDTMYISEGSIYQNHRSIFTLQPYSRITRTHHAVATARGIYKLQSAAMTGGDLFGLFLSTNHIPMDVTLAVYPKLLGLDELPSSYRTWQGELEVSRWLVEDPFLITGTREYSSSDPMNRIHWKASARTGALQVYKQGYTAEPEVMLIVNVQVSAEMWNVVSKPEEVEAALSYAATIASHLQKQGMRVGFAHNAHTSDQVSELRILPAGGDGHLEELLRAMAAVQMKCRLPFEQLLSDEIELQSGLEDSLDYVFLTAFVSPRMQEQIELLRAKGSTVLVLSSRERLSEGGQHEEIFV